jgi:type III restriction enzyme
LDTAPDLSGLDAVVAAQVEVQPQPDGTVTVTIHGDIPDDLEQRLIATATNPQRREAMRAAVQRHRIIHRNSISPAARGEKIAVPRLFLYVQGELEFVEKELILELGEWTLNDYPAELTPAEFAIRETAERWELDMKDDKVVYYHLDQHIQLEIGLLKLDWTDLELSRWLDRECHKRDLECDWRDITQLVRLEFCRKLVTYLMRQRRIPLKDLVRFKFQLAKAVQEKISVYRQQAYASGYQTFLFDPEAQVETSFNNGFAFEKSRPYPAKSFYRGGYQFKNHFFGPDMVGELDSQGEEFECAKLIDSRLPQVKHWIRNLAGPGRSETSFWLPTSTDRFYPDFVAELQDGRILVIEYKGKRDIDTPDTQEKKNIGGLWAAKSDGKGLFLMAEKQNSLGQGLMDQIRAVVG